MKSTDTRKFAIYSRKSKFTGKGESIENQIELCKQRLLSMEIPESDMLVFEDEGFSGGNTRRPQFQAMMEAVRAGEIRGVICYRLDRISRNVGDFAAIQKEFEEHGVDFISLRDNFDTTTPTGRAMMLMTSVFSQLERETIAERIRDNMHELAKSGRWLGGTVPTGYKSRQITGSVTVDGKERKAFKLEIVPEEAELVRLIFQKFLELRSLTKVDAYLLEQHARTKNGREFTRFSISNILRNPVYAVADQDVWDYFQQNQVEIYAEQSDFDGKHGIMAYNKTAQRTGKTNRFREMDEWIIAVGKHQGLIPGREWVRVQETLQLNKSKSYRRQRSNSALLSGLLVCGECGAFLRPKQSQRKNGKGELVYTYICERKERSHGTACNIKSPNGNELDRALCAQLGALAEDKSEFHRLLDKVEKSLAQNGTGQAARLESLRKEQRELDENIKNLVVSLGTSVGRASAEYVVQQIDDLDARKKQVEAKIRELEDAAQNAKFLSADLEVVGQTLRDFGKSFDTFTLEQKRAALRVLIRRVVWDGENVHVYLFGSDEAEIDSKDFLEALSASAGAEPEKGSKLSARIAGGGSPLGKDSK